LAWELAVGLARASAGFAAREGDILSRNFAKIFFNISGEATSVCESAGFATPDMQRRGFTLGLTGDASQAARRMSPARA